MSSLPWCWWLELSGLPTLHAPEYANVLESMIGITAGKSLWQYMADLFRFIAERCRWKGAEAVTRASGRMDPSGDHSPAFLYSKLKVLCTSGERFAACWRSLLWAGVHVEVHLCRWVGEELHAVVMVLVEFFACSISSNNDYVHLLLSMKVLEGVIKYRWNALPVEQRDGIKNYISDLIVQVLAEPQL